MEEIMTENDKKMLAVEADMQVNALKKIRRWRQTAIAVSTVGAAAVYAGFKAANPIYVLGISGIVMIVLGIAAASILNLGIRNGERNVQKILELIR
jgi:hypothetical protein